MFNNGAASHFGSSEFGQSKWGQSMMDGRSVSAIGENNQEKCKHFVDNYDMIELLSVGAHSVIWKVRSRITGQFFVLKIVKKIKYGRHWRKLLPHFQKYKTIEHASSSKMYQYFHDKQNFYLVHELIEGRTLYEEYLMEGGFTEVQTSVFVKQMIQYLSVLHNQGEFHSDIKPSNIMVTKPPLIVPSQSVINANQLNPFQKPIPNITGANLAANPPRA